MRATKEAILLVKTPQINIVLVHLWYSPSEYQFLQVNTSFWYFYGIHQLFSINSLIQH